MQNDLDEACSESEDEEKEDGSGNHGNWNQPFCKRNINQEKNG